MTKKIAAALAATIFMLVLGAGNANGQQWMLPCRETSAVVGNCYCDGKIFRVNGTNAVCTLQDQNPSLAQPSTGASSAGQPQAEPAQQQQSVQPQQPSWQPPARTYENPDIFVGVIPWIFLGGLLIIVLLKTFGTSKLFWTLMSGAAFIIFTGGWGALVIVAVSIGYLLFRWLAIRR